MLNFTLAPSTENPTRIGSGWSISFALQDYGPGEYYQNTFVCEEEKFLSDAELISIAERIGATFKERTHCTSAYVSFKGGNQKEMISKLTDEEKLFLVKVHKTKTRFYLDNYVCTKYRYENRYYTIK